MTELLKGRLDQIVIVTEIATPTALQIKSVWATPYDQIVDFVDSMRASRALGTPGVNRNAMPFVFKKTLGTDIDFGVWAVRGLRTLITKTDNPTWNPSSNSHDSPGLIEGAGVQFPVDLSALTTPTIGITIDGLSPMNLNLTASAGDLAAIIEILNADVTFAGRGYAYATGSGDNKQLTIESQSLGPASNVVISVPGAGDDANALVGLTTGDTDIGEQPVELFHFTNDYGTLIA